MKYLLDTNAYFNVLCYQTNLVNDCSLKSKSDVDSLVEDFCFISELSTIEIVSVIGKYSRRPLKDGGWSKRTVKAWRKHISDLNRGNSCIMKIEIVKLNDTILAYAKDCIELALTYNFGSLDSLIMGTFLYLSTDGKTCLITSDKGLKAAMEKKNLPVKDVFKDVTFK